MATNELTHISPQSMKRTRLFECSAVLALATAWAIESEAATFYSSTILSDQPVAYWSFDETDGNAIQQAPLKPKPVTSENDLVPTAGAGRVSHVAINSGLSKLGNAADFSGANFFRAAALRAGKTELTGAYAIEFWMQVQGENTTDRQDYLMNIGNNGPAMIYDFKPDQIEMFAGSRTDNGPVFNDTAWHHVLFVYYGDAFDGVADRVDAYFDGANYPYIGNLYTKRMDLSQLVVGAALANGANGLEGRIDEVAIYDLSDLADEAAVTAKISAAVVSHMNAAKTGETSYSSVVMADQPLLYWNFDENEGDAKQLMPITLAPLDNTLNELQPYYGAQRITHTLAQSGLQLGNALDLNGAGDFFGKVGGLDLGMKSITGPWAMEMWFQLKGEQEARYLVNMGGTAVSRNSPGVIYGYFGKKLEVFGSGRSAANGVTVSDSNWHHLLIVNYNTAPGTTTPGTNVNQLDFYIDNVLYQNTGGGFNKPIDLTDWVFFGTAVENPDPKESGSVFARLDEFAIYDFSSYTNSADLKTKADAMAASHYAAGFGQSSVGTITITEQPLGVTAAIGQSVTFTSAATVTGTSSPLVYQWQRNGAAIEGATNPTYAISAVSINEIGTNEFRVLVSAGAGFKFSDAAQLVVAMPPTPPTTYYSSQVLKDSPLYYWNFDEMIGNANQVAPISRKPVTTENDLVPAGGAGPRISHVDLGSGLKNLGKAVSLDGASFFVSGAPRLARSIIDNAYVIEVWAQFNGGSAEYIANFGPTGGDNTPALIHNFTSPGYLEMFGAGGRTATNGPAVADTDWHHLVWVNYNNAPAGTSNRVDVYWDGVLATNVGGGFSRNLDTRGLIVGAALSGGANAMSGAVDEFAVYDLAGMTADQIFAKAASIATNHFAAGRSTATMNYTSLVLADNPMLYYNFEETEGNAIQLAPVTLVPLDNTANTLVNSGAGRVQHSAVASGLSLGNAIDLNGVSYFQAVAPDPAQSSVTAPWALEFWVQVQGENQNERQDYFMSFGGEALSFIYDFKPDQLEMFSGGRTDGGPTISDAQWHHVMWVFYGDGTAGVADRADAYLDGVPFTNVRNTFTRAFPLSGTVVVGAARPGYNGFQGRLDEVAVYDLGGLSDEGSVSAKVSQMVTNHMSAALTTFPTLNCARSGNVLTLTWSGTGFVLQENNSITAGSGWTDVANGQSSPATVTIQATGNRFFRLIKQ
jgi:hypothetical protein